MTDTRAEKDEVGMAPDKKEHFEIDLMSAMLNTKSHESLCRAIQGVMVKHGFQINIFDVHTNKIEGWVKNQALCLFGVAEIANGPLRKHQEESYFLEKVEFAIGVLLYRGTIKRIGTKYISVDRD